MAPLLLANRPSTSLSTLPAEIIDIIVGEIADGIFIDAFGSSELALLLHVSRAFLHPVRRRLYRRLSIRYTSVGHSSTYSNLYFALAWNPSLLDYVRSIRIWFDSHPSWYIEDGFWSKYVTGPRLELKELRDKVFVDLLQFLSTARLESLFLYKHADLPFGTLNIPGGMDKLIALRCNPHLQNVHIDGFRDAPGILISGLPSQDRVTTLTTISSDGVQLPLGPVSPGPTTTGPELPPRWDIPDLGTLPFGNLRMLAVLNFNDFPWKACSPIVEGSSGSEDVLRYGETAVGEDNNKSLGLKDSGSPSRVFFPSLEHLILGSNLDAPLSAPPHERHAVIIKFLENVGSRFQILDIQDQFNSYHASSKCLLNGVFNTHKISTLRIQSHAEWFHPTQSPQEVESMAQFFTNNLPLSGVGTLSLYFHWKMDGEGDVSEALKLDDQSPWFRLLRALERSSIERLEIDFVLTMHEFFDVRQDALDTYGIPWEEEMLRRFKGPMEVKIKAATCLDRGRRGCSFTSRRCLNRPAFVRDVPEWSVFG